MTSLSENIERFIHRPSAASLFIEMSVLGQPMATGTGFVVSRTGKHYLVTNRHNLSGRTYTDNKPMHSSAATPDAVTIAHNLKGKLGNWVAISEPVVDADGAPLAGAS
jgi:hypothetical protein